jgi:hypothetical protein
VKKGDYESAPRDFDEEIRLRPNAAKGYTGRGWAHSKRGRYDQAYYDRGWYYVQKGDYGAGFRPSHPPCAQPRRALQ